MFTNKDLRLIENDNYFKRLRKTEDFVEIQSRNTGHCWIIQKNKITGELPIRLHHKHRITDQYYHMHRKESCVRSAVKQIQSHDIYVLNMKKGKDRT